MSLTYCPVDATSSRAQTEPPDDALDCIEAQRRLVFEDNSASSSAGDAISWHADDSTAHHDYLRTRFKALVRAWKDGVGPTSSMTDLVAHPAYQEIIAMGRPVIPLLLEELAREPDYWFWALAEVSGEDPIPARHLGNLEKMTQAWLAWGKRSGY